MKNKVKKPNIPLRRKLVIFYKRFTLTIKIILLIFIVIFCFTHYFDRFKYIALEYAYDLSSKCGLKITVLKLSGRSNAPLSEIQGIFNFPPNYPILKIDINKIVEKLKECPWIENVMVQRLLPNTIHIVLLEKIPIAIWQINRKLFLIDSNGNKITDNYNHSNFSGLLHIVGDGANIYASTLIGDLSAYPDLSSKIISIERSGGRRWDINLVQDIKVQMPEYNFRQMLEYLAKLHQNKKLFDQNYKILDLRDGEKSYIEY